MPAGKEFCFDSLWSEKWYLVSYSLPSLFCPSIFYWCVCLWVVCMWIYVCVHMYVYICAALILKEVIDLRENVLWRRWVGEERDENSVYIVITFKFENIFIILFKIKNNFKNLKTSKQFSCVYVFTKRFSAIQ